MRRAVFAAIRFVVDPLIALLSLPGVLLLRLFKRIGAARMPLTRQMLRFCGLFPVRDHYYEPLFQVKHLDRPLSEVRDLPGVDLDEAGQLALLERMVWSDELLAMKLDQPKSDPLAFRVDNGSFGSGDAEFLYQFIRLVKPRKILEIGSGNSTRIAHQAVIANKQRDGVNCAHFCIEPYEMPWLEKLGVEVFRTRVEACSAEMFSQLRAGDLLFIDSSHVIRPQGDVLFEYQQLIPSLASGVYVHVHDIFTPRDYLTEWLTEDVRFWNEQYLLEVLIANSARYRVIAALNFLKHSHFERLHAACPYLTRDREPGSFYFRIV